MDPFKMDQYPYGTTESDRINAALEAERERVDAELAARATTTTEELHLYVDGDNGDDGNDGRSASTPKKTLQAAVVLLPAIIRHNVCFHLSGTITIPAGGCSINAVIHDATVVLAGEDDWTIIDDNGGSKYTTTSGTDTTKVEVSGAGWTNDEHAACYLRWITGPSAGKVHLIQWNDADTILPCNYFAANPGVGATFDVVRPKTALDAATFAALSTALNGECNTGNYLNCHIQQVSFLRAVPLLVKGRGVMGVQLHGCYMDQQSAANYNISIYRAASFSTTHSHWIDPDTFVPNYSAHIRGGVGLKGANGSFALLANQGSELRVISALVLKEKLLRATGARLGQTANYGTRYAGGIVTESSDCQEDFPFGKYNSSSNRVKISNPSGQGMLIRGNSTIYISGTVDVENSTHGIEARENSTVKFLGATAGSGNTGAGVYAHLGAKVTITDGSPPTLTGTVGDLSTDGSTQKSTWAAIDGGTPVADTTEMVVAKEM